ncbi:hypothetical protein Q3G72_003433 [Acer saccharum]|nr:hypothetical protein Q3G72_003433 [Acer saccharum]
MVSFNKVNTDEDLRVLLQRLRPVVTRKRLRCSFPAPLAERLVFGTGSGAFQRWKWRHSAPLAEATPSGARSGTIQRCCLMHAGDVSLNDIDGHLLGIVDGLKSPKISYKHKT